MLRFDPFREIEELQQRMDRAFGGMGQAGGRSFFSPVTDIHEDERGLEVDLDLPGVSPEHIRVEAEGGTLTVQAERRAESGGGRTAHRTERVYGTFVRTFSVPPRYDLSRIEANYENGTLRLRIPRSEQSLRRAIPVKAAGGSQPQPLEARSTGDDVTQGQDIQGQQDVAAQTETSPS